MNDTIETENGNLIKIVRTHDMRYSFIRVSVEHMVGHIDFTLTYADLIALRDTLNRYIDKDE